MIYSLGYSHRSIAEFVAILKRHRIAFLVDVRSAPYSRYRPEFSKQPLARAVREAGLRYLFLGDLLGGMPDDPALVGPDGRTDYRRVAASEPFKVGLARLLDAEEQGHRLALMCAEAQPEGCHRARLIGTELLACHIDVHHIDKEEVVRRQSELPVFGAGAQLRFEI